ncbi:hypothetical protein FB451DRAFT_1250171 [Mycena latifolia]|nr:hypothetical protein FB451DRAFT_1250171 [Mycena latifolia]
MADLRSNISPQNSILVAPVAVVGIWHITHSVMFTALSFCHRCSALSLLALLLVLEYAYFCLGEL